MAKPAPSLAPGLYEAILTDFLQARLPTDEKLFRLDKVDRADIARILASHVGSLVEKVLMAPHIQADAGRQVAMVNDLIQNLVAAAPELGVFGDQTVGETLLRAAILDHDVLLAAAFRRSRVQRFFNCSRFSAAIWRPMSQKRAQAS